MNTQASTGTMDLVVLFALALSLVFVIAWSVSPALRAWIERPKYRFQKNLRNYEQEVRSGLRREDGSE